MREMAFIEWKDAVLAFKPGYMAYDSDLRPMYKQGLTPGQAYNSAAENRKFHRRGSASAPEPVNVSRAKKRGAGRGIGNRRMSYWSLAMVQKKVEAAILGVVLEAEAHSMDEDGVAFCRDLKRKIFKTYLT